MICFHGTTPNGMKSILNKGQPISSCWHVSDYDGYFYVWSTERMITVGGYDPDDIKSTCLQRAFESAQAQAACGPDICTQLFVLVFDIPDEMLEDDTSCEGMQYSGAMRIPSDEIPKPIAIFKSDHNPRCDVVIVSSMIGNRHLNVDPEMAKTAQVLNDVGAFIDTDGFGWTLHRGSEKSLDKKILKCLESMEEMAS